MVSPPGSRGPEVGDCIQCCCGHDARCSLEHLDDHSLVDPHETMRDWSHSEWPSPALYSNKVVSHWIYDVHF